MLRKKFYKDMDRFRRTANAQRKRYYARTANAKNGHQRWTEKEIEIVMAHEKPDREISAEIGRSVQAIQVMRSKMLGEWNEVG